MIYTHQAKYSTIHRVDLFLLEVELAARRIRCEVPNCASQAITIYGTEMPSFVCLVHDSLCKSGLANVVKATIVSHVKRLVLEAANRAWAGSENEVVFAYDPFIVLDRHINAAEAPEQIMTKPEQVFPLKARPALPTLPSHNEDLPLMEFFPL